MIWLYLSQSWKYTVENAWEMCCSTLQKIADPKKNISMYKIPFVGEEWPIKKKRRKRWINFVLERRKMWMPGKKFYFKIHVPQYRCLNLDANCYCYFLLFIDINAGHIWNLFAHAFSLFSLGWVCSDRKRLCYLILNMHATRFSKKKKTFLVKKKKT